MTPIFEDYRTMLKSYGIDLSQYDTDKLWIDRLIIRGFDKNGNDRKILRLKVTDELEYEYKRYADSPKNDELETWEESYKRLEPQIIDKEQESISVIKQAVKKYPNYQYILTTSMGKDSKLVQYLLDKCDVKYRAIFNNTTLDCTDVYKEVKHHPEIEIVQANFVPFYKAVKLYGTPARHSRWCCSIYKEGGTKDYLKNINNILFFMGMRNEESSTRSDYDFEYINPQWQNKTWNGYLPIRKWTELELWLYELHNNIPINSKYKKGYGRVGCHVACPFYTKSTWILDKYWYPYNFNRWHNILKDDFEKGEKWCRLNCTESEYHLNWNGGIVREEPTDEVIKEFMEYKGFDNYELTKQYFTKTCKSCGKKVYKKDEVAMNLKYHGRNTNTFYCKKCFMKEMNWTKEDWDKQVNNFKQQGCTLF